MKHLVSRKGSYPRGVAVLAVAQALTLGVGLPATKSMAQPAASLSNRKVTLDFVQADVNDVAKALSVQSGVNVVLMPSVKGNVTVRLVGLSPEEALQKTAASVGADVRKVEGTYFLGSTTELRAMMAKTGVKQTWKPKYISSDEVKMLVEKTFPYVTADSLPKTNILVLVGDAEEVAAAIRLAESKDLPGPEPVKVEVPKPVKLRDTYSVKFAKPSMLVETLEKAFPDVKVTSVEKTLVLEGTQEQQVQVAKLLTALDTSGAGERVVRAYMLKYLHPHQASFTLKPLFPNLTINAGFESYSPDPASFRPLGNETGQAFSQQGLSGSGGAGGTSTNSSGGGGGAAGGAGGGVQDLTGPGFRSRMILIAGNRDDVEQATQIITSLDVSPPQILIEARIVDMSPEKTKQLGFLYDWNTLNFTENNAGRKASQFGGWTRAPFNWQVTLEAMEQSRDARILARPNIAVVDSEEASIFIGDILRYERLESNTAAGQTYTIETVPVGVALLCRPRVTDGQITLRVHPVVSSVTDFTGRNHDIPITSSREAESIIRMKDGETIAIGGLLREQDIKILTKVPILGNLPFIGELFKHRNDSHKRSEVTIFITAKILKQ